MGKGDIPERFRQRIQEAKEKHLEELDLSSNDREKLTEVPPEVFDLTHLKVLKLKFNRISRISESLGKLTNLTILDLYENKLTELPKSLGKLTNLKLLFLSKNKLTELPESLGKLTNLSLLNSSENKLKKLPQSIGNLDKLTILKLWNNQLKTLPESLGNLNNLKVLNLWRNKLTTLPESLGKLTSLDELYLDNNQLTSLPESLGNLTNLTHLNISVNPLVKPPIELAEQGIEEIMKYFQQLKEEGVDYIYEAKLLIVGEGGAGKTTLAKKIDNPNYNLREDEESTKGIDIIKYSFPILDKEGKKRDFKVNIWDFGGQEIYHATHQFFLTKRSLYTLVADTRKEDTDFYYWLNVVELLSDNSPLLIIKNEKQNRKREINETGLRGQFTNLEKTLATNLANNRGLEEIVTHIQNYIKSLPHIGEPLPKTWAQVRQALEQDKRNYISLQEYLEICEKNGFTRYKDKLQLGGYLHDLGVCLHFQDEEDSLLYRTVILKPTWGTDAVYKVLDNDQVVNNQGYFTRKDLKSIWHEEKYVQKRGELLELMKKFQLCYQIPGNKNAFIAPQLLSDNQPEYAWDESSNLILRYTYPDFMPKGIITRFIVAMHEYIERQEYVWKSGVILAKDNARAEVIEYYGKREIRIRTTGDNSRDFMAIITYELDKIIKSYNRLKYSKLIPCNCPVCKNSQSPHSYPFETLQKFLADRQEQIQCQKSYEMVNVLSLIDDVGLKPWARDEGKEIHRGNQESSNISISNVETVVLHTGEGQIKMNNKQPKETRNINTGGGNYNENIEGDYIQQRGTENTVNYGGNINREINTNNITGSHNSVQNTRNDIERPPKNPWSLGNIIALVTLFVTIILGLYSGILTEQGKEFFKLDKQEQQVEQ